MIKTGQLVHRFSLQVIRQLVFEAPSTQNLTFKNKLLTINQRFLLKSNQLITRNVSKITDGSTGSSKPRRKKRGYSIEDNKFLIEQVKLKGYNLDTFKKASKELRKENFYNVKSHYDEIIQKQLSIAHTISPEDCQNTLDHYSKYTTDLELSNHILHLKNVEPKNISSIKNVIDGDFIPLAKDLNQSSKDLYDYWMNVIIPYLEPHMKKLRSSNDIKEDVGIILGKRYEKEPQVNRYTKEEKKFIAKQVKLLGDSPETWVTITKAINKGDPHIVKLDFDDYIAKKKQIRNKTKTRKEPVEEPKVSEEFSDEEDEIIVSYVEQFGRSKESFTRITEVLGRGSPISVEKRYNKLISKNEYQAHVKVKGWFVAEDEALIKSIFELKSFKYNDFMEFDTIKPKDLKQIAIPLKRSPSACFIRWMNGIVPILKTHINDSPKIRVWKKDLLSYIAKNNIKDKNELDLSILHTVASGQTIKSVVKFLDNVRQVKVDGAMKASDLPLHELALKTLSEQPMYTTSFNKDKTKMGDKRLERAKRIVAYYESLFKDRL